MFFLCQTINSKDAINIFETISRFYDKHGASETIVFLFSLVLLVALIIFIYKGINYLFIQRPYKKIKENEEKIQKLNEKIIEFETTLKHFSYLSNLAEYLKEYIKESYRIKTALSINNFATVLKYFIGIDKSLNDEIKYLVLNYIENIDSENINLEIIEKHANDYIYNILISKLKQLMIYDDEFEKILKIETDQLIINFFGNIADYQNNGNIREKLNEDINDFIKQIYNVFFKSYESIILKDDFSNLIDNKDV